MKVLELGEAELDQGEGQDPPAQAAAALRLRGAFPRPRVHVPAAVRVVRRLHGNFYFLAGGMFFKFDQAAELDAQH